MKVNGVSNDKNVKFGPVVFKRGANKFLTFYAQPVWSMDEFNAVCPPPVNRSYIFTKNGKELDDNAPAYLEELKQFYRKRWGYVMLKSLEPSKIEWGKVNPSDPKTWSMVEEELREELSIYEFAKVAKLVDEANALDEEKLEENAKSFFQLAAAEAESDAPNCRT